MITEQHVIDVKTAAQKVMFALSDVERHLIDKYRGDTAVVLAVSTLLKELIVAMTLRLIDRHTNITGTILREVAAKIAAHAIVVTPGNNEKT